MPPVKHLGPAYVLAGRLNLGERRVIVGLNLAALALFFLFGWLFLRVAGWLRPEDGGPLPPIMGPSDILLLIAVLLIVVLLHELIHALFFWIYTRDRPEIGLRALYAFAAAPNWYLSRNRFLVVGLAPLALLTLLGLLMLRPLPAGAVPLLVLALSANAAGSLGDIAVVGWLATRPPTTMVRDTGSEITFYEPASADIAAMNWRWQELMRTLGIQSAASDQVFLDLVTRYGAEGRYYHNLGHVEATLSALDEAQDLARDITTLQLAAWFHDVIYDPQARDNEDLSGRYAERVLVDLGLPPATAARVRELIVLTRDHIAPSEDIDAAILLDADLASFAYEPAVFESQSELIRKEYDWMPDRDYYPARMRFLTVFLSRPRIYQTDRMYCQLEAQARENITRHLATLANLAPE